MTWKQAIKNELSESIAESNCPYFITVVSACTLGAKLRMKYITYGIKNLIWMEKFARIYALSIAPWVMSIIRVPVMSIVWVPAQVGISRGDLVSCVCSTTLEIWWSGILECKWILKYFTQIGRWNIYEFPRNSTYWENKFAVIQILNL
jgi:hypothetical protein